MESEDNKTIVVRSKSSDLHKKSSPASSNDTSRNSIARLSHFSSLKQWGKNRLRLINRNSSTDDKKDNNKEKVSDIDDFNVYETVISKNKKKFLEKERKLSHERKPSYSSSEKSLTITSQSTQNGIGSGGPSASINPVKMRESTSIRRQRRIGLGNKDEINSSSGNWSASSESGRTSIGSEITTQPKSSASSSSLNHSHHHPGSGPPSSIISRRRFLNTSASSSVTSEGTVTPDLQVHDFYDDETSSAYSCDTEGYYTSFHVDSGLKTLKEEEPATPLHISSALSSTNSFGSTSNQTVISAEAEYELFGKGSTSTTASSAGTVCTTLRASDSNRSLGPSVPERKSSLTRLHRSNSNVSNGTLERSYSSSTVGSSLERTGTIKRNGVLLSKEISVIVHSDTKYGTNGAESGDSGHNTSSSPIESNSSPVQGGPSTSEFEYSESSDLEGVERIERIRTKTKINSSRIPSLCVITPSNSDDETVITTNPAYRDKMPLPTDIETNRADNLMETDLDKISFKEMDLNSSRTCSVINELKEMKKEIQHVKKTTLLPLNSVFGKLRGVLPNLRKSPFKDTTDTEEPIYDGAGEYVTIADVTNNNQKINNYTTGVYYSNDIVKRNLATVLSGNLNEETEYISLNELPCNIRCDNSTRNNNILAPVGEEEIDSVGKKNVGTSQVGTSADEYTSKGARVTLDAHGKIVYSSDSLKRRKGAHTTFAPGPCVKQPPAETESVSSSSAPNSLPLHRQPTQIRPVVSQKKLNPVGNGAVETRPVNQVQSKPTISGRLSSESSEKSSASLKTGEMSIYGNRFSGNGVYETIKDNRFINGNRESFSAGKPITKKHSTKQLNRVNNNSVSKIALNKEPFIDILKCEQSKSGKNSNDPNLMNRKILKRSDSYRMANSPLVSPKLLKSPTNKHIEEFEKLINESFLSKQVNVDSIGQTYKGAVAAEKVNLESDYVGKQIDSLINILSVSNGIVASPNNKSTECISECNPSQRRVLHETHFDSTFGMSNGSNLNKSDSFNDNIDEENRRVARSLERLINEFSLITTNISSTTEPNENSYLKTKSIENIESSADEFFDSDTESSHPKNVKNKSRIFYTPTKNKITIPTDCEQHRARVLSFSASNSTEIW